jgi:archaemetzincin
LYVTSLGHVDSQALDVLESEVGRAFGSPTRRMMPLPDPAGAYDATRGQYGSVPILRDLLARVPEDALRLLAVTERDLFIPMLSFIYGQAQLGGMVAVVSLARLRQEFYGLPADAGLLAWRALKESLHELGHTFNLVHCPEIGCTMSLLPISAAWTPRAAASAGAAPSGSNRN